MFSREAKVSSLGNPPPGVEVESNKNVLVYERTNKADMKHAIREQKHESRARAIGVRKVRLGCDL